MKKTRIAIVSALALVMFATGCSSWSNTGKGAAYGGGGGALLGAGIGALAGGGKGAAVGAAIGAGVGAGTGALIGRRMDKQKAELEKIENAKVETVTDKNNLQAIKVTFDEGILFASGKSVLSASAASALAKFATSLNNSADTDVTIYGHTDNTGSREVNQRLSEERAQAVASKLKGQGVAGSRLTTKGLAFDDPIADNATAAGRAQNRRVEIYITASAETVKKAEAGELK